MGQISEKGNLSVSHRIQVEKIKSVRIHNLALYLTKFLCDVTSSSKTSKLVPKTIKVGPALLIALKCLVKSNTNCSGHRITIDKSH